MAVHKGELAVLMSETCCALMPREEVFTVAFGRHQRAGVAAEVVCPPDGINAAFKKFACVIIHKLSPRIHKLFGEHAFFGNVE